MHSQIVAIKIDDNIRGRISALVDREHELRRQREHGSLDEQTEHEELMPSKSRSTSAGTCSGSAARNGRRERPYEAATRPRAVVESYSQ